MNYKHLALITLALILFSCEKKPIQKTVTTDNKTDSLTIRKIFDSALTNGQCYEWLDDLTSNIGGRLSGSPEAQQAVEWGKKLMEDLGFDKVWLQPIMVPHWVRGEKEVANYTVNGKKIDVPVCALGGSIATPPEGITGEVIEVFSIDEAKQLGEKLRGKIVFFNRPFDATLINTFQAYGGCVDQRGAGAKTVGPFGALAIIVRSMSLSIDDYPHTGAMGYGDIPENKYIPSAAISTLAADKLSKNLKENPNLKFYLKQSCETLPDAPSFNVIGEITGSEYPNKYITIGGHLDSWDLGDGAHDDGTGIVQSLEVLHLFKANNIKPKNTLRVVFFMDEEQGGGGARAYAEAVKLKKEIHVGGLESDAGGHTPRGFTINANAGNPALLQSWKKLLAPYGLHDKIGRAHV